MYAFCFTPGVGAIAVLERTGYFPPPYPDYLNISARIFDPRTNPAGIDPRWWTAFTWEDLPRVGLTADPETLENLRAVVASIPEKVARAFHATALDLAIDYRPRIAELLGVMAGSTLHVCRAVNGTWGTSHLPPRLQSWEWRFAPLGQACKGETHMTADQGAVVRTLFGSGGN